jgi:rhodanese-related sulfurtransferase
MLIDRGFKKVRPLAGGLDAWVSAGYDVEVEDFAEPAAISASE